MFKNFTFEGIITTYQFVKNTVQLHNQRLYNYVDDEYVLVLCCRNTVDTPGSKLCKSLAFILSYSELHRCSSGINTGPVLQPLGVGAK